MRLNSSRGGHAPRTTQVSKEIIMSNLRLLDPTFGDNFETCLLYTSDAADEL